MFVDKEISKHYIQERIGWVPNGSYTDVSANVADGSARVADTVTYST